MVEILFGIIVILLIIIVLLCFKIYYLQKAAKEIADEFAMRLTMDTNTLIDISTADRHMRNLANKVNEQLRLLRKQRQKYLSGDRELKEAVTNISHDLRTPLAAICGYLELLEQEEKSEKVTKYLAYIEKRTQALKHLTEELFKYSVILSVDENMAMEEVNIKGVLEECIASFYGALVEKGITPVVKIPENAIIAKLNKVAVSRVFSNILNNALKYSNGDLQIEMQKNGEIIFTNSASNLDEIQVGKLFDRFFTVEAARNSTGLGLAISKTLVEQMGGSITARYTDNKLSVIVRFISVMTI